MPKTLHASALLTLPDDEFAAAKIMVNIEQPWNTFLAALKEIDSKAKAELKTAETKAAVMRRPRRATTTPAAGEASE